MNSELEKKIKDKIEELNATYTKYHNWEQGTKIMINSFYGGLGNQYMYFFDPRLAECITKQGKSAILYAEKNINDYFLNHWYEDKEVHERLGVTVHCPVKNQVTVYIDTDSCDKDTIIHCHDKDRTIEELYNECEQYGSAGNTMAGHESVRCPILVLNQSDANGVYFAEAKRVIRHKVKKKKWKLVSNSGKYVIVTGDHSLIVFRGGKKIKCKPNEIESTDYVLIIMNDTRYKLELVKSIECIGEFEDEYVYDIEMVDDTHTFVANDILVHNSVYSQLDEIISTTDWGIGEDNPNWKVIVKKKDERDERITTFCGKKSKEYVEEYFDVHNSDVEYYKIVSVKGEPKDFAIRLDDVFLSSYFKKIFDAYAEKLNADNYLNFELETYSDAGIWLSKKKYMQNIRWTDSMPRHDILDNYSKIKSKGVELIQASSPAFARKHLSYLVKWIFQNNGIDMNELSVELKKIRDCIKVADVDTICWNKKATGYMKWVLDDTRELVMQKGTPATTKGIAYYNFLLNREPKESQTKYSRLTEGSKCKYYYCKGKTCDFFAYEPGNRPVFAPDVDYDTMFEKIILAPINRIVVALGFEPFYKDLCTIRSKSKLF